VVSEFMLQQTQVSRVLDFYPRFLARFPTAEHLARARPRVVREAWEGLGYYRRATNLHALAKTVVRDRGGAIPSDPEALRALPGIGRYTAGAVASFAYQRRTAAVDTNVARVLRRAFLAGRRAGGPAGRAIWDLAEKLVPRRGAVAWEFNQAVMELGARVCVARKPRCEICPVRPACFTGARARPG
jgi:A/G-specific adenine glycosylase